MKLVPQFDITAVIFSFCGTSSSRWSGDGTNSSPGPPMLCFTPDLAGGTTVPDPLQFAVPLSNLCWHLSVFERYIL